MDHPYARKKRPSEPRWRASAEDQPAPPRYSLKRLIILIAVCVPLLSIALFLTTPQPRSSSAAEQPAAAAAASVPENPQTQPSEIFSAPNVPAPNPLPQSSAAQTLAPAPPKKRPKKQAPPTPILSVNSAQAPQSSSSTPATQSFGPRASTNPLPRTTPGQIQQTPITYWLQTGQDPFGETPPQSRHNTSCQKFRNVPGRPCSAQEGQPCPICKG